MQGFWDGIDGSKEKAISGDFVLIPDNTKALAEVQSFKHVPSDGNFEAYFQVNWKIVEGEHKNRVVFQKLKVFDPNVDKSARAKNMMMMLYKMFNIENTPHQPTNDELLKFNGKLASITIMEWHMGDKCGNWVKMVESTAMQAPQHVGGFDSDVPF